MDFTINYNEPLGDGQLGRLYQAHYGERRICAKVIQYQNLDELELKNMAQNLKFVRETNHPNLVKIYLEQYSNEEQQQITYMEYYDGSNLMSYLQNHDQNLESVFLIIKQILQGFQFLHENKIQFNNIKLTNILLDNDGNMRLSDLWFPPTERNYETQMNDIVYLSPQVMNESKSTDKKHIYSLGIVFYYIVYRKFPYGRNNQKQFFEQNKLDQFKCPEIILQGDQDKKQKLKDLIEFMIKFEEAKRIDWIQLFKFTLFKPQSIYNSFQEQQDSQFFKLTRVDQDSVVNSQQSNLNGGTSIQILSSSIGIDLQLNRNPQLNQSADPQENLQVDQQVNEQVNLEVNPQTNLQIDPERNQQVDESINQQGNMQAGPLDTQNKKINMISVCKIKFANQTRVNDEILKFSNADITKIIQIFIAKVRIAEQGIELLRKNQIQIRELYVSALIFALNGYKSNLLVNAVSFAYNIPKHINKLILEQYKEYILSAIEEFSKLNNELQINIQNQLQELIYQSSNQFAQDYRLFNSLLDVEDDRLDGLDQLGKPKESKGIYSSYQDYMQQIQFIFSHYFQDKLNPQRTRQRNKIIVISPIIKIIASLKYICKLEENFNFTNYTQINPEDIRIDDAQYINLI